MKNRKIFIIISSFVAVLIILVIGIWYVLNQSETVSENVNNNKMGLHYLLTEDDGRLLFSSDIHKISFLVPSQFSLDDNSDRNKHEVTNVFRRDNKDTSEEPNRNTPNQFNTAADDIFEVTFYPRNFSLGPIVPYNQSIIEWYDSVMNLPKGSESFEEFILGENKGLFTIKGGGIDSSIMYFYLELEDYLIVISSSDVSREEVEEIIISIQI